MTRIQCEPGLWATARYGPQQGPIGTQIVIPDSHLLSCLRESVKKQEVKKERKAASACHGLFEYVAFAGVLDVSQNQIGGHPEAHGDCEGHGEVDPQGQVRPLLVQNRRPGYEDFCRVRSRRVELSAGIQGRLVPGSTSEGENTVLRQTWVCHALATSQEPFDLLRRVHTCDARSVKQASNETHWQMATRFTNQVHHLFG